MNKNKEDVQKNVELYKEKGYNLKIYKIIQKKIIKYLNPKVGKKNGTTPEDWKKDE